MSEENNNEVKKNRRGRPSKAAPGWYPGVDELNQIVEWLSAGETVTNIAKRFGLHPSSLYFRMKSRDPRILDENGCNRLEAAVNLGRATAADPILDIIYRKAIDPEHREQMRAGTWWLEKVAKIADEPTVVVINQAGEEVDLPRDEVSKILKEKRKKMLGVIKGGKQ